MPSASSPSENTTSLGQGNSRLILVVVVHSRVLSLVNYIGTCWRLLSVDNWTRSEMLFRWKNLLWGCLDVYGLLDYLLTSSASPIVNLSS